MDQKVVALSLVRMFARDLGKAGAFFQASNTCMVLTWTSRGPGEYGDWLSVLDCRLPLSSSSSKDPRASGQCIRTRLNLK